MKITTLIENLVYQRGLQAEHGLSMLIEAGNKKILFDTGQSAAFIRNAKILGIDVSDIDVVVISHGHYDHAGGLYSFLETNSKAKIYIKKNFFIPKYHTNREFIGIEKNIKLSNERLVYVESVTEIFNGIFIMPDIPLRNPGDTHFRGMLVEKDAIHQPDDFKDELYLAIKINNNINIITACSHRGITNICNSAIDYFKLPVGLVLGGFHLKNSTIEQFAFITAYFKKLNPHSIGVCHCTGVDMFSMLKIELGAKVFYNFTGNIVELN